MFVLISARLLLLVVIGNNKVLIGEAVLLGVLVCSVWDALELAALSFCYRRANQPMPEVVRTA
ncbi:hypothetical protein SynBIOSU31_02063 [Synechococcus sp. BIOS-U3-1]|nr:hypothetical protein SynBIOSU31_02063 [Synechococcus sp. BIOS-U3-1]